jgi:hypothetical protein
MPFKTTLFLFVCLSFASGAKAATKDDYMASLKGLKSHVTASVYECEQTADNPETEICLSKLRFKDELGAAVMVESYKVSREIRSVTYLVGGGYVPDVSAAADKTVMTLFVILKTIQALNPEATKEQRGKLVESLAQSMNIDDAKVRLGNVNYRIYNGEFLTFTGEVGSR